MEKKAAVFFLLGGVFFFTQSHFFSSGNTQIANAILSCGFTISGVLLGGMSSIIEAIKNLKE